MSKSTISIDAFQVIQNLDAIDERTKAALGVVGNTIAQNMKGYAQTNKKWIDRTSSAKNELTSDYKWEGDVLDISITHGVDYGIWLETNRKFNGKYAILFKARDSQIEVLKSMVSSMGI